MNAPIYEGSDRRERPVADDGMSRTAVFKDAEGAIPGYDPNEDQFNNGAVVDEAFSHVKGLTVYKMPRDRADRIRNRTEEKSRAMLSEASRVQPPDSSEGRDQVYQGRDNTTVTTGSAHEIEAVVDELDES